jgi:DNA polymerase-4/DNA polymerase IV (DinB-like DNA polymerase)
VLAETRLTCSVGIGYNMMSAKIASEEKKPDGFFVIPDDAFLRELIRRRPVSVLNGIGRKSVIALGHYGIRTIEDLWAWDRAELRSVFGQFGEDLYLLSRGQDDRVIASVPESAKSYGKEITYQQDLHALTEMDSSLRLIARQVSIGLQRQGLWAGTVTLKFKYDNLESHTRSLTLAEPTNDADCLFRTARDLLHKAPLARAVRLLGISTSHLSTEPTYQLSLEEEATPERKKRLNESLLTLYDRFGQNIIKTGAEMESEETLKDK